MSSRPGISSKSNRFDGSMISRWTTLLRSKTDDPRTHAFDQTTPPSGTETDTPPASSQRTRTVYSAETPSAIAKSWEELVVKIIERSLVVEIFPSGYEFLIEWVPRDIRLEAEISYDVMVTRTKKTKARVDLALQPRSLPLKLATVEFDLLRKAATKDWIPVKVNGHQDEMFTEKTAEAEELHNLLALTSTQSHTLKVTFLSSWKQFDNLYQTPNIAKWTSD